MTIHPARRHHATLIAVGAVMVALAVTAGWLAASQRRSQPDAELEADPEGSVAAAAPQPREPTLLEDVMSTDALATAIEKVSPHFADTTDGPSSGAAVLAVWMAAKGHATQVIPGSLAFRTQTLKAAKKDISRARGIVLCFRGDIVQIARDDSVSDPLYHGTIMASDGMDFVHFFAAGNTGALVDGDAARFCGVVTGRYSYANVSGGQTQSIQMVGAFDLRRNVRY